MQKFDTESLVNSAGVAQSAAKKANTDIDEAQVLRNDAIEAIRAANQARDTAIESVREAKRTIGTVGDLADQLVIIDESFPEAIPEPSIEAPLVVESGGTRSRARRR